MRYIIFLLAALLPLPLQHTTAPISPKGQIIIFVRNTESQVINTFHKEMLPQIKALAEESDMECLVHDISGKDAPREVTYTPFIAYRNGTGRSYFSGRWNQIDKVRNFIRTSKVIHQEQTSNTKSNELVWQQGRINILAPLKITKLKAEGKQKMSKEVFHRLAMQAVEDGTQLFNRMASVNAGLDTRSFYMAIYPYLDKRGRYHITGEVYSQYNCVEPIYTHFEEPIIHKNPKKAIQEMARMLEEQIALQIHNPAKGDGFDPVPKDTPEGTWDSYGKLSISSDSEEKTNWSAFEYKKKWKVAGAFAEDVPLLLFRFAPPLDNYTGEISQLEGTLELEDKKEVSGASGRFSIPITAITMGDFALDKAIHKSIIKGEKHPRAEFEFGSLDGEQSIVNGKSSKIWTRGRISMNGYDSHLSLTGKISPYMRDGKSYLHAQIQFSLDKSGLGVEKGPDGPEDIKEKMEFFMSFLLD